MSASNSKPPEAASTIEQTFSEAVARQKAGDFPAAERLYRVILDSDPEHAKANHNLGALAVQTGRPGRGLPYLLAAVNADPVQKQYWLSYIDALALDGQVDDARQTLALARQHGLAGQDVDALASRLHDGVPRSEQSRRKDKSGKRPKTDPSAREVNSLVAAFKAGQRSNAIALARAMTERFPGHWLGWKVLGVVLQQMGMDAEALAPMEKTVALAPKDAEAHYNLGVVLQNLGRLIEAEASYLVALRLNPAYEKAYVRLAGTLKAMGRLDEAVTVLHGAAQLNPSSSDVFWDLGMVLTSLCRLSEAEAVFRRVIQIDPAIVEAYINLSAVLRDLGQLDEAEANARRAVALRPDSADAQSNLGLVLHDRGRLDEAEACWRQALRWRPDFPEAYSNLLFCMTQNATADPASLFAKHRAFAERFEAPLIASWQGHANSHDPDRVLRVGFVSGDLRNHAVAYFIEPLLAELSGCSQISLYAYANHIIHDDTSERLRSHFAHWRMTASLADAELADRIRADGIDILIDLSGHTAKNRLLVFARKPAPLLASWMGYPGTTGLSAMDYYLADRFLLPPGQFDDQFTEKIVRLPAGAPFLPDKDAPPIGPLPAIANGYLTFGSFNRMAKLGSAAIALWSQLLRALPDSRMLMGGMPEGEQFGPLIEAFAREGVGSGRLEFHARSDMKSYLELHRTVDVCLDTFPYNGGTTTLHALWMGVPTLSLAGHTVAGRSGAAVLGHVGLDGFIAHDATDFLQKGIAWAGDLVALSEIRTGLRERFAQSAQARPALIAAGLERALRIMWRRWCAGLAPESFEVTRQEVQATNKEAGP
jgi:predicted O-linked N-acetylglucosamine transferase (SPINDLY family)